MKNKNSIVKFFMRKNQIILNEIESYGLSAYYYNNGYKNVDESGCTVYVVNFFWLPVGIS